MDVFERDLDTTFFYYRIFLGSGTAVCFPPFFHRRFYLHKVYAIIKLLFIFIRELFKANIAVTKDVLRPKLNIQPAIFAMPTRLESEWEITILSLLITLTPGTLVMDVSDDNSTIYIHAINTDDIDDIITDIQQTFEKAIMEVSR